MADFDKAISLTLQIEGGYSNNPSDNGGETFKGIARKFNPSWEGWKIIDNLKKDTKNFPKNLDADSSLQSYVKQLYKQNYWDVNRLDQVMNQEIANEIFDNDVNLGVGSSAKIVQEALNLLNRNQKDYQDLKVDGAIGNTTLSILNGHKNPKAVLRTINGLQFMRYVEICKNDPSQEIFFNGWLLRA
jgi:lysozyme family protein